MIAKTLALTLRAIREDARLLRTHLFRLFLLAIIVWFLVLTQWDDMGIGAPGLEFFTAVTYLDFCFISLAGIGFFASAITEEKEEMTLGLLRMAGIGPMALLTGKLLPRLLGAVLLLSVQFPFTLLAITLGGVSLQQVAAAYCTLFTYTLMLSGVALFCSVASRLTKTAALWTSVFIGLFLFVPWWFRTVLGWNPTGPISAVVRDTFEVLHRSSPLYRLSDIMRTGFLANATGLESWAFGYQAMANTAAAVGFFLLSWLTFNWFNRDEQSSSPTRGLMFRSLSRMRQLTGGRVWGNALFWKDLHFIAGGPLMALFKLALYGLVGVGLFLTLPLLSRGGSFTREEYGGWTMWLSLIVFMVEGVLLASNVFRQEVKWKTWPSLVMLPTSLVEVAYSKIAGCLFGLLPVVAWFCFGALCAPESLLDFLEEVVDEPGFYFTVTHYILLLHLAAFLSLFVKWMAFPLAIGLVFMTNFCCLSTMARVGTGGNGDGMAVVMIFLGGFAVIVLHIATAVRLQTLAGR